MLCLRLIFYLPIQDSIKAGSFSIMYSNTPSGPRSTCRPWGNARVLTLGCFSLAILWISSLSPGFHIEAQNYRAEINPEMGLRGTGGEGGTY
jgi:hypothetical protein